MVKELDVHIRRNNVWVSHDKAEFEKIRECSHMILFRKYDLSWFAIITNLFINPVVIHGMDKNALSLFKIRLKCC